MRNIFDQYSTPENRVTHALMSALDADRALLQRFIGWVCGAKLDAKRLDVRQQSLPGIAAQLSEDEAERRGLPDGCVSDGTGWALLIESKVMMPVVTDQLRRHLGTAQRHGISKPVLLLLTAMAPGGSLDSGIVRRQWRELYCWLLRRENRASEWAGRLRQYLEVAETRLAAEGYLTQGALTMFAGIPFASGEEIYSYPQAKRVLGLLRGELLQDERLVRRLGMDRKSTGRGAITGTRSNLVWDFISLQSAIGKPFTSHPHLTLGVLSDRLEAYVTVPNALDRQLRKAFIGESYVEFRAMVDSITRGLALVCRSAPGSVPRINVVQRHYRTQRAEPSVDCQLRFDPRTAFKLADSRVKHQPQWLEAAYAALSDRQSNLQFQIGQDFPYQSTPAVGEPGIVRTVADAWLACEPLVRRLCPPAITPGSRSPIRRTKQP